MNKDIIHCYLDLPPLELNWPKTTNQTLFDAKNLYDDKVPFTSFLDPDTQEEIGLCWYTRAKASYEYYELAYKLIPELMKVELEDVGFQKVINYKNHPKGVILLPHTDGKRGTHCIHWTIDPGGPEAKTIWWQEPNQSLTRPSFTHPNNYWADGSDISNFTRLDEIVWEKDQWGIFRTDILHSVHPVIGSREAFCIGFSSQNLYLEIIEKYGRLDQS